MGGCMRLSISCILYPPGLHGVYLVSLPVPRGYGVFHVVVPRQDVACLPQHGLDLSLPEGDRPGDGGEHITADIERQQPPEFLGNGGIGIHAEVAVHQSRSEDGRGLGAPHDAVELLPRVSEVVAVEVDDDDLGIGLGIGEHHVADVVVPVLEGLGTVTEQVTVLLNEAQEVVIPVKMDGAIRVHLNFAVDLGVEPRLPIGLICGGGDGVDTGQVFSRVATQTVLYLGREGGDGGLGIHPVDPGMDGVDPLLALSDGHGQAHGDPRGGHGLLQVKESCEAVAPLAGGDTEEVGGAVGGDGAVFLVPRPAVVDGGEGLEVGEFRFHG